MPSSNFLVGMENNEKEKSVNKGALLGAERKTFIELAMKIWKPGSFMTMKDCERTSGFWASYLIFSNVL